MVQEAQAAPANAPAPIDLTDETIQEERVFSGEVVIDESVNGDYGPQWHFAIRPLEYTLNTKTGAHHEYVPTDKRGKRTKFGIIVSSVMLSMGEDRPKQIGAGLLVGYQGMFVEKTFKFGTDRETSQPIERDFLLFLRPFNDEDKARISQAGTLLTQVPTSTFSDDEIEAIAAVVDGKSDGEVTAAAARSKLPQNLKAAVLSGSALPRLVDQGHLAKDPAGRYVRSGN